MKKIVIVGGGIGGLELVTKLSKTLGRKKQANITLIDKNTSHLWKPLLHEIATGSLNEQVDNIDYLAHAQKHNFEFKQGRLININCENKYVTIIKDYLTDHIPPQEVQLDYDILVIAVGSTANDFATVGVKEHCIFLDDQNNAIELRSKLLAACSNAILEPNNKKKINIAIVGAGATGVELASELPYMAKQLALNGYNHLNTDIFNVTLIEATDRILSSLPEKIALNITKHLRKMGIKVLTKTMIKKVDNNGFCSQNGDLIPADIMIWTAGIKVTENIKGINDLDVNKINQLIVKSTLQTTKDDTIFAIGDCCYCMIDNEKSVPPTGQAAHQMVSICAANILNHINKKTLKTFKYRDKGTIISLCDTAQGVISVTKTAKIQVKGFFALIIHRLLYRMHLVNLLGVWGTINFTKATKIINKTKSTFSRY